MVRHSRYAYYRSTVLMEREAEVLDLIGGLLGDDRVYGKVISYVAAKWPHGRWEKLRQRVTASLVTRLVIMAGLGAIMDHLGIRSVAELREIAASPDAIMQWEGRVAEAFKAEIEKYLEVAKSAEDEDVSSRVPERMGEMMRSDDKNIAGMEVVESCSKE
ncbi:MAG: hypothetical protein KatS3mg054_0106 [Chloroflexus sp.]|nr:MAG: hypothetical protein KatS3mg054_0106 [Chloroflexus sp.]